MIVEPPVNQAAPLKKGRFNFDVIALVSALFPPSNGIAT